MSDTETDRNTNGGTERDRDRRREERGPEEAVEAVAASTVRVGLAILGLVIVLFAAGQALGFDALAIFGEAFETREVRWMIVAFFGLILIAVSLRGFRY